MFILVYYVSIVGYKQHYPYSINSLGHKLVSVLVLVDISPCFNTFTVVNFLISI